jgi:outer membrane protein assembly factor BamB
MPARPLAILSAICMATSLTLIRPAHADDYPQWRGPQRTGLSKETGLLKEWPQGGPRLLWQVKDVGYGYGSPAVSKGRIYLVSNTGLDNEFVQALDAKDGKQIWSTKIGQVGNPKQMPSYPGARSTPTVDGDAIYVLGSDGDMACLEAASGKIRWQKNVRTEFGGVPGIWAYSESPLVDGDVVVCTPGGSAATIVALNKKTGDVVWKSSVPGGDPAGYASAVTAQIGGIKQYVQFLGKGLVGVDAKSGKFLWRFDKTADMRAMANAATPVAFENHVYSAAGMVGGGLARIKADNGAFDTEPVYFSKRLPVALGGSVKVGDHLYGTSSTALLCVDWLTGNIKWEDRAVGPSSVCYADGRLYVHGENTGEVALVEATPDGYREKGRFTPPEMPDRKYAKSWAYPVVANGRLYIRDLGTLWCYDVKATGGSQ